MAFNFWLSASSRGMYGSGNYDAGYTQATTELEAESQKLNAIVGVLAAIVVLLVLALLGGAYFLHQKTKKMAQIAEESVMTSVVDEKETESMVTGH
jgi:H+/gluconate symporter-like permease